MNTDGAGRTPFASEQAAPDVADGDDKFLDAFARELMQSQGSLEQELFKGIATPEFGFTASAQEAATQVRMPSLRTKPCSSPLPFAAC